MSKYAASIIIFIFIFMAGCGQKPVKEETNAPAAPATNTALSSPAISQTSMNTEVVHHSAKVVNQVKMTDKRVALTFDDGPDNKYTPRVLDILKKNQIHATFFLIGENAQRHPQVINRILQEGHSIGNHSWDHQNLSKQTIEQIQSEIGRTDELLKSIAGQDPVLFRAPYGAVSPDVLEAAGSAGHQVIIGWSVDTLDWKGKSAAEIMNCVKKEVRPGGIILQHSSGGKGGNLNNTIEALPLIIAYLKDNGYSFVTVPELLAYDHNANQ
ncbi:polysaccharide deacetylase family protein [Paenibacillus sp. UNC451MF]|uniref:polysaccharide deacetylase family protein n=1 Tax=Paenibacillus sp. UNC451MF TaxID=1449063 RepID=UPI000AE18CE1|nr:polysaccharide deacetylase family protein [Paenibacillus sp. UNC451MF]